LVTGANGFVGTYLTKDLSSKKAGEVLSFPFDLREKEKIQSFFQITKPDLVYHLAAQPFIPIAIENPWETQEINVTGTLTILESLHRNLKPCKMLYVSSADVYGRQTEENLPLKEELNPEPLNPYSGSKLAAESYCRQYSNYSRYLDVVVVRPFNHTGAGQRREFVIPNFCHQIKESHFEGSKKIKVGDLTPTRDFLHVKDVIRGYQILMEKGEPGQVYNISSGIETSIEQIIRILLEISGHNMQIEVDSERVRPSETPRLFGNSEKIQKLGWTQVMNLRSTLEDVYHWVAATK